MTLKQVNLQSLKSSFPSINLDEIKTRALTANTDDNIHSNIEVISARNGSPVLKLNGIFMNSSFNPEREADKLVDSNLLYESECVIFSGLGLGYEIESYLNKNPSGHAVLIEPLRNLFMLALENRDLSSIWQSGRISIIFSSDLMSVNTVLGNFGKDSARFFQNRILYTYNSDAYDLVRSSVLAIQHRKSINSNTLDKFGKRWVRNLIRNLDILALSRSLDTLADSFPFPFLLLCAGPGLSEVLPCLQQLRQKTVIVCVDTALRQCRRMNIEPDFVVSVDPQYWNFRHFDYLTPVKTAMITDSSCYPPTLRSVDAPLFCGESVFPLGQLADNFLETKGRLGAGGSVATSAWDFCRFAGAVSVYFAGLDLGFPDGQTHVKGSYFEERMMLHCGRLHTSEEMLFHYFYNGSPFPVEANNGSKVYTDQRMVLYKWWFEQQDMNTIPGGCFSFSQEGVKIKDIQPAGIEQLLAQPDIRPEIDRIKSEIFTPYKKDELNIRQYKIEQFRKNLFNECELLLEQIEPLIRKLEDKKKKHTAAEISSKESLDAFEKNLRRHSLFPTLSFLSGSLKDAETTIEIYRSIMTSLKLILDTNKKHQHSA